MNDSAAGESSHNRLGLIERRLKPLALIGKVGEFAVGHALLLLNPELRRQPTALEKLVMEENAYIDDRQNAHLVNILRHKKLDQHASAVRQEIAEQILNELKTCKTISESFEVFMDPRYENEIYTLDLGETKEAGSHEAVAGLKSGYIELKDKLVEAGVIEGEIPREKAKRTIIYRQSDDDNYYVADRNRVLFCFEKGDRKIAVLKRQTFLVEKSALPGDVHLQKQSGTEYLDHVQGLIDREDESITPVRTHYFATNQEIKER